MKSLFFVLLLCSVAVSPVLAAAPTVAWTQTYGGETNDFCYDLHQAYDFGYLLAGKSVHPQRGDLDFYAVRTNSDGSQRWERRIGGEFDEWCHSVEYIPHEGWALAGFTESFGSGIRAGYIVRLDTQGDTLWTRAYGNDLREEFRAITATSDGGFIAVGTTNSPSEGAYYETYVVRIDADGEPLWTNTFTQDSYASDVKQTSDGGFVLGCGGYNGVVVIKLNADGDLSYFRSFAGNYSQDIGGIDILPSGEFIFGGHAYNYGANPGGDMYCLKLNSTNGDTVWSRARGGTEPDYCYDVLYSVNDDTYVLAGLTTSYGYTQGVPYLLAYSNNGNVAWVGSYEFADPTECRALVQGSDLRYAMGCTQYGEDDYDMILMVLDPDPLTVGEQTDADLPAVFELSRAYPNPFNSSTRVSLSLPAAGTVKLTMYNVLGHAVSAVASGTYSAGRHHFTISADQLPSGVYYIQAATPFGTQTQRLHLLK